MKKYHNLGELLVDYRNHRQLTQLDFAAMLDVDVRTIIRWEKNETLIKSEKEKMLIEEFGIPHQVLRNLNTDLPIPVYFDFKKWMYSLTLLSSMFRNIHEIKNEIVHETSRIETLSQEQDFNFISYIQKNQKNCTPLNLDVVNAATKILPELNMVIREHSGFHGGHVSILPLKYHTYELIRDRKMNESEITVNDISRFFINDDPQVFYYYSIYSNSRDNNFYLLNKLLFYFKKRNPSNYIFAGISYQKIKVERFREAGFQIIWEQPLKDHPDQKATFLSGNFNSFLFQ